MYRYAKFIKASSAACLIAATAWAGSELLRPAYSGNVGIEYGSADSLLRRKHPILTLDELAEAVDRADRRRHVRAMVDALGRARARTDSVAETELRLDAADAGLPEFEVNGEIRDGAGRFLALGDLVHRPSRVLLEYDGEQHRLDRRQYGRDVERLDALAAAGWRVIRVNATHRDAAREAVLARTRAAISSRTRAV